MKVMYRLIKEKILLPIIHPKKKTVKRKKFKAMELKRFN